MRKRSRCDECHMPARDTQEAPLLRTSARSSTDLLLAHFSQCSQSLVPCHRGVENAPKAAGARTHRFVALRKSYAEFKATYRSKQPCKTKGVGISEGSERNVEELSSEALAAVIPFVPVLPSSTSCGDAVKCVLCGWVFRSVTFVARTVKQLPLVASESLWGALLQHWSQHYNCNGLEDVGCDTADAAVKQSMSRRQGVDRKSSSAAFPTEGTSPRGLLAAHRHDTTPSSDASLLLLRRAGYVFRSSLMIPMASGAWLREAIDSKNN